MGKNDSPPLTAGAPEEEPPASSPRLEPTVVGIGASAGGLAALRAFFEHVPEKSGLAFVVVVHLSPDRESHLVELLQPHVNGPVTQVTETTTLEANHVYVIPPDANLNTIDTHLRLSALEECRCNRAPIDHFFSTLAETHDGHAIGVILTGTGSDGTLGIKKIQEAGGLTLVQDPGEAEYDGMPQSAISTGLVDRVLPLAELPEAILRLAHTRPQLPVPTEEDEVRPGAQSERQLLQKIFAQIRACTGRNFSRYKRSTILRRLQRRMQLRHVEELVDYVELLRKEAEEVKALSDDLLITVTEFFRDPEVFEALEKEVIPQLFEDKGPSDDVRVWSVGCATGEEAYSLAILLLEAAAHLEAPPRLQIFASDLHEHSLDRAREAFYPGDIEADVSEGRLERFFHKENGGYRIRQEVRDLVVFAPHNLMGDPPFSHLDLISCRNLLIYLERGVQQEVMELFHYALKLNGFLVLGTSETIDASERFRLVDKKNCIYRKRNVEVPRPRLPVFPLAWERRPRGVADQPAVTQGTAAEPLPYGKLHQRMVERYASPSLLVSPDDKVVHLSERAGRYLAHPGGELTGSVFKLVREELRVELRSAVHAAREENVPKYSRPIRVQIEGVPCFIVLDVRPVAEPEQEGFSQQNASLEDEGFVLVIFDERAASELAEEAQIPVADLSVVEEEDHAGADGQWEDHARDQQVRELEAKLSRAKRQLQNTVESYETSQEELKASNEELQSANEELRSTLEELETSKEELQSMNEELQTVNQENRHKVEELAQLSSDLQNLMAATDIATLFLNRKLHILRFTPPVEDLFNVREADCGRPISDFTHRLGYDELQEDARKVLRHLVPVEREVQDEAGRWYLTRVLPYRSAEDRIEGVVITFVDITKRKEDEEKLRQLNESLEERTVELEKRNEKVRQLSAALTMAEQEERDRIAHMLHEELQQTLVALKMEVSSLHQNVPSSVQSSLRPRFDRIANKLDNAIDETRSLSVEMSPPVSRGDNFSIILDWLVLHMREHYDMEVVLDVEEDLQVVAQDLRVLLYQMVKEVLFNVVKHAQTDRACLQAHREEGTLILEISDEGVGFDPEHLEHDKPRGSSGFGLDSIRHRLKAIGGHFDIESSPGQGTSVRIIAPLGSE